ncbi:unnamed protein product [Albugo candida]|uniref:Uncharacterized protein n=1 Tax=Albugo candida TaxID=65357 RepID=A0A024G5W6_9STRA|nr:unnamed protein product [Albugo candida]|eukprot:CCI42157.1 unnamed protein product [Albugo candida]
MCTCKFRARLDDGSGKLSTDFKSKQSLFFPKAVYVEEIARSCWKKREWISGLSNSMCELLRSTENDEKKKEAFQNLAYHIAKVSNTYVVSTLSYYILTSSFDYEHVIKFHGSIESSSIEITSYGYTDLGSIAHSLSYTAVAKALDRKLYRLVNMEYPWNGIKLCNTTQHLDILFAFIR